VQGLGGRVQEAGLDLPPLLDVSRPGLRLEFADLEMPSPFLPCVELALGLTLVARRLDRPVVLPAEPVAQAPAAHLPAADREVGDHADHDQGHHRDHDP
jgi:hypothetical protein